MVHSELTHFQMFILFIIGMGLCVLIEVGTESVWKAILFGCAYFFVVYSM